MQQLSTLEVTTVATVATNQSILSVLSDIYSEVEFDGDYSKAVDLLEQARDMLVSEISAKESMLPVENRMDDEDPIYIKVEVDYDHVPEYLECFLADIRIYLPSKDGMLLKKLRSATIPMNQTNLYSRLGTGYIDVDGTEYRCVTAILRASSLEDLESHVETTIHEAVTTLREVMRLNNFNLASLPANTQQTIRL